MVRKVYGSSPVRLTIGEAAALLEVSINTLRRWDAAGHLPASREPRTGRRLYDEADIIRLRERIEAA